MRARAAWVRCGVVWHKAQGRMDQQVAQMGQAVRAVTAVCQFGSVSHQSKRFRCEGTDSGSSDSFFTHTAARGAVCAASVRAQALRAISSACAAPERTAVTCCGSERFWPQRYRPCAAAVW